MGDKFQNKNKHSGKKPTKKELKAQNHLKLMEGHKKDSAPEATNNFNKEKKAA